MYQPKHGAYINYLIHIIMKAKRIMLLAAVLFVGVFTLSAQTKDEVKADKAKARKEIPAYRQKGYAGSVSLNSQMLFILGLETSHGYMFNEHHYLGAGVGFNIFPYKVQIRHSSSLIYSEEGSINFTPIFVEYKAFLRKRSNTPVLGARAAFTHVWWMYDGQIQMRETVGLEPVFGWDWKLKDSFGLNVALGVQLMYNITNDNFGALPRVSLGFQF